MQAKALLKAGADVVAQDSGGDTALHWACRRGDRGMAAMLLEYDPDKTSAKVRNNKHQTAAALAKGQGVARLMAGRLQRCMMCASSCGVPRLTFVPSRGQTLWSLHVL